MKCVHLLCMLPVLCGTMDQSYAIVAEVGIWKLLAEFDLIGMAQIGKVMLGN